MGHSLLECKTKVVALKIFIRNVWPHIVGEGNTMREIKFLKADLAQAAKKVERLERLVKEKGGHYIHFVKDVLDDFATLPNDKTFSISLHKTTPPFFPLGHSGSLKAQQGLGVGLD